MALSAIDVIGPAFHRMKRQLFQPFRLGEWIRLAVVGLLAGEVSSAGGCNLSVPSSAPSSTQHFQTTNSGAFMLIMAVGLLVVLGLALLVALIYVSSRMRFVLLDSVLIGHCHIGQFWANRAEPAFRYFTWQILFTFGFFVGLALLIGIPLGFVFAGGWLTRPAAHVIPLVLGGVLVGLALLLFIGFIIAVHVLTKDFVVPQMALDNVTAAEGWRRLWPMMKREKGGYAGYLGMKFILTVAAAVVVGIALFLVLLVLLIPVGGFGVVAVIGARAAGLTWNPVTIAIVVVAATILIVAFIFLIALISVPTTVFFPAYSIHFFAERYPVLRTMLFPPPAAPGFNAPDV